MRRCRRRRARLMTCRRFTAQCQITCHDASAIAIATPSISHRRLARIADTTPGAGLFSSPYFAHGPRRRNVFMKAPTFSRLNMRGHFHFHAHFAHASRTSRPVLGHQAAPRRFSPAKVDTLEILRPGHFSTMRGAAVAYDEACLAYSVPIKSARRDISPVMRVAFMRNISTTQ